ncbi:MAG: hypothetical protein JWP21_3342 [Tardiphaga sp.]|nr:hypothetical protein [Tardiphaga sp.]
MTRGSVTDPSPVLQVPVVHVVGSLFPLQHHVDSELRRWHRIRGGHRLVDLGLCLQSSKWVDVSIQLTTEVTPNLGGRLVNWTRVAFIGRS